jgi:hypothetical protein
MLILVIPAQAGIQFAGQSALKINQMNYLDSRLRGNDGGLFVLFGQIAVVEEPMTCV